MNHITQKEKECPCGCGFDSLNESVINRFELIRKLCSHIKETPITINSACRCQSHNDSLPNSAKNSQHIQGTALDLACPENIDYESFYDFCDTIIGDDGGVGKYTDSNFVHIDIRNSYARWGE